MSQPMLPKKKFVSPTLTVYGDVRTVTANTFVGGVGDGSPGNNKS
jgi:hypothetical protein